MKNTSIKGTSSFFLVVIFSLSLFVFSLDFVSAQTTTPGCQEVPLPNLPFTDGVDPCSSPAAYIRYWFYFSLYLAGIAALLALVLAGAWRVFFATSPSSVSKSNQWIVNAILGLILLFGSWLLLRTLGGSGLTTLRDPALPNFFEGSSLGGEGSPCRTEGSGADCKPGFTCQDPSWWPFTDLVCTKDAP